MLLFGTFRVIASNAERAGTGMTSEALGVSVAPSFFQSCVSDGKTARMEDVLRFKASKKVDINHFDAYVFLLHFSCLIFIIFRILTLFFCHLQNSQFTRKNLNNHSIAVRKFALILNTYVLLI